MPSVKITIITPSFNQAQFLEQTIDSVLSQNYPHLEYILIDGGSTDGSLEIIKKYQRHFSYWVSEKDTGQSNAINKGLAKSSGEVVNWLNSDDYLEPGALKFVAESFENPNTKVLCARSNILKNGKVVRQSQGSDVYQNNLAKTIGQARIDQPETFFRRSAFDQVGLLNEDLHYVMDREWWMRYLLHFGLDGIKKVDDIVVNFRLHEKSKTESKKSEFEGETALLYLNLSKKAGFSELSDFFENFIDSSGNNLMLKIPVTNQQLIYESIQYFLLLKANQYYHNLDFEVVKKLLGHIDKSFLQLEDQHLMNKISFRTQLPASIIKIFRKWMSV